MHHAAKKYDLPIQDHTQGNTPSCLTKNPTTSYYYTFWELTIAIQDVMGWFDCSIKTKIGEPLVFGVQGNKEDDPFFNDVRTLPRWKHKISK